MDEENRDEENEQERARPRVVDKRVSARGDEPIEAPPVSESTPQPPLEPSPEPPTQPEAQDQAPESPVWTPEQEAEARRMAEEIARTPSLEWVVNLAVTLANVAGTKLDIGDPVDAQLAIDALAAILDRVGSRLDRAEQPLRETLAQLQLAYAERAGVPPPPTP